MDLSSSFFLGMEVIPKKKGAKKGGSSFFIQMAHDPPFFKATLEKMRDPPLRLRKLPKCSKSRDLTAIAICDSNRESQITSDLKHCEPSQKSSLFWLLVWGKRHCDSNVDSNRGSNHKSRDLKVRFEPLETPIWGKFLRFGLRDFKSLAICDLWFGALRLQLQVKSKNCKQKSSNCK